MNARDEERDEDYALAGAYVLDALDPEERDRFEAYLAISPAARAEVESLREAAALLGSAAVETPPEGLKQAVLAHIDTMRQLPPVVTDLDEARTARRDARPVTREWVTNLSRGAAAIAAVVAIGLGVAVGQLSSRLDEVEAANSHIATVVAAADVQQVAIDLPDGGRISAVMSPAQGVGIVVGDALRPLDEDEMYALWAITDGVPLPVGELVEGRAVAVDAEGMEGLGVTIEPRGPLDAPTSDPLGVLTV